MLKKTIQKVGFLQIIKKLRNIIFCILDEGIITVCENKSNYHPNLEENKNKMEINDTEIIHDNTGIYI